ncbi:MAG: DUF2313 domain-containing protein [Clostridia bacterium]|nr:DUF2313 domain-containing protein [Clostridia bacterium]
MERRIIDYLPYFIRRFDVYEALCSGEQAEFESLWDETDRALSNQFIYTADEYGISRAEAMMGIVPKGTDSLERRRSRVSAMWFNDMPLTMRWLGLWLDKMCGTGAHSESADGYTLEVMLDGNALANAERLKTEIAPALEEACPAALLYKIGTRVKTSSRTGAGAYIEYKIRAEVWPG